jgi:diguanylate cyclase (GGDEF)-like protein
MNPTQLAKLPEVLFEIGKAFGAHDRLAGLLSRISELLCDLTPASACSIMLLDASRTRLLGKAAYGLDRRDLEQISFEVGEGVAGWVAQHGESTLIGDVTRDARFKRLPDSMNQIRSLVCVPLDTREGRVGVVTLTAPTVDAFVRDDLDLLGFVARTMALDVENMRLRRLAVTDQLTGAFNREFLQRRLPQAMESSAQRREPLSVAMIDVDHFKAINDAYGHAVGDRVLVEVASRLRGAIRGDAQLVRYGGEEFMVILPRADAGKAAEVGERIRAKLGDAPIEAAPAQVLVRVSIGVAEFRGDGESAGKLIERADVALYAAKGGGRDRVEVAS